MPVLTFIGMTLVMVWLAGELWFARPTNTALSGFAGAALLLLSNAVWLANQMVYSRCDRKKAPTAYITRWRGSRVRASPSSEAHRPASTR